MNRLGIWRYRQFHPAHLLMWLCIGILMGLLISKAGLEMKYSYAIFVAPVVLVGIIRSRRWWALGLLVVLGLVIGVERGSYYLSEARVYKNFAGAQVLVQGSIFDDPVYGTRGDQQFRLQDVRVNGRKMIGQVYVGTYSILDVKRGDRVELKGKLSDGFGSFQGTLRYATLVSAVRINDPIREMRDGFAANVRNIVAEPAASLGLGFVVGQRSALPDSLDEQLRIVGLTHIVVASGYNLTILVRFTRRVFARYSKYLAALSSTALMTTFVFVSGLSPSMTRAALVTGLSLLAWYYGRRFHPLLLIIYVAALTALWNPIYIWSDLGWYLSFLAFGGVLILAPMITRAMFPEKEAPATLQLLIETISAQLMTLPLILLMFGQLPVLSVFANILVAPVIPLAMLVTALSGLVAVLPGGFLGIIGICANYIIGYVLKVVEVLSAITWAQMEVSISEHMTLAFYGAIILGTTYLAYRTKFNFRTTSVVD